LRKSSPLRYATLFVSLACCWNASLHAKIGYMEPWGKDHHLTRSVKPPIEKGSSLPIRIADAIIQFHQEVISPVDGPRSHFRPTSSRYMQLAMYRYGFLKGWIMGCDRLLRENDEPWVYRTIQIDGKLYKYDPAAQNKYVR
jgi:uncharacterized protein